MRPGAIQRSATFFNEEWVNELKNGDARLREKALPETGEGEAPSSSDAERDCPPALMRIDEMMKFSRATANVPRRELRTGREPEEEAGTPLKFTMRSRGWVARELLAGSDDDAVRNALS